MGRKSTKENKNIYQVSREAASLTRETAAEQLVFVSSDRIEKIEKEKNRLIEITVDGVISADEMNDFEKIQEQLTQVSMAIDSLQLWVEKAIADGRISPK